MNDDLILKAVEIIRSQTRATLAFLIVGAWVVGIAAVVIRAVCTGQLETATDLILLLKEVVVLVVGFYFITQGVYKAVNGREQSVSSESTPQSKPDVVSHDEIEPANENDPEHSDIGVVGFTVHPGGASPAIDGRADGPSGTDTPA